jgi:hypothetical protein
MRCKNSKFLKEKNSENIIIFIVCKLSSFLYIKTVTVWHAVYFTYGLFNDALKQL